MQVVRNDRSETEIERRSRPRVPRSVDRVRQQSVKSRRKVEAEVASRSPGELASSLYVGRTGRDHPVAGPLVLKAQRDRRRRSPGMPGKRFTRLPRTNDTIGGID